MTKPSRDEAEKYKALVDKYSAVVDNYSDLVDENSALRSERDRLRKLVEDARRVIAAHLDGTPTTYEARDWFSKYAEMKDSQ